LITANTCCTAAVWFVPGAAGCFVVGATLADGFALGAGLCVGGDVGDGLALALAAVVTDAEGRETMPAEVPAVVGTEAMTEFGGALVDGFPESTAYLAAIPMPPAAAMAIAASSGLAARWPT